MFNIILIAGAIHGMFLSVFLFAHKKTKRANGYLATLIFLYGVDLFQEGLHGIVSWSPHLIGGIDPLLLLYGPLLYGYAAALIQEQRLHPKHLLPCLIVAGLYLPWWFSLPLDVRLFTTGLGTFSPAGEWAWHVRETLYVFANLHEGMYVWLTLAMLKRHRFRAQNFYAGLDKVGLRWLSQLTALTGLLIIVSLLLALLEWRGWLYLDETSLIIMLLCAALVYFMGYKGLKQPRIFVPGDSPTSPAGSQPPTPRDGQTTEEPKYRRSGLDPEQINQLLSRIDELMASERLYLESDLRLSDLAEHLNASTNHVSQAINQGRETNFYQLVNGYRVDAAKKLLQEQAHNGLSLLDIAGASGFNSKSSFNGVFKKVTGLTPTQYLKQARPDQTTQKT